MSEVSTLDAPAASSAADSSSSPVDLAALSHEDRQYWRLNGELPQAASPSASPTDTSATDRTGSTEPQAQPASDAGALNETGSKPEEIAYKAKTKERIDTLLKENAELKRLQAERDRAAATSKPAPSPAVSAASAPLPEFVENPSADQPLLKSEQFFAQFPEAEYEDFTRYAVNHALAVRDANQQRMQAQTRIEQARTERINAFVERASEPGFVEQLHPDVASLVPAEMLPAGSVPNARNVLAQEIMVSEHSKSMLKALSGDDLAAVDRLTDVASVIRFCARLEARVAGGVTPPAASSRATVSNAPAPGTTIGSKAKAAADPVESAIASDDFRTFRELENAREMKRMAR